MKPGVHPPRVVIDIDLVLLYCITVCIPDPAPEVPACRDIFDLPFLQLAVAGRADALVTGDQDLLSLGDSFGCPIVTAEQFVMQLALT